MAQPDLTHQYGSMFVDIDIDALLRSGAAGAALFAIFALIEAILPGGGKSDSRIKRIALNLSMPLIGAILLALVPFSTTIAAAIAEREGIGLFQQIRAPAAIILAVALLVRTLLVYWLHRAAHHWAWLWRIHRVHHSDTAFDLSLALRHHPLEALIALALYGSMGLVLGLPVWAALAVDTIMLAAAFWEHIDASLPEPVRRRIGTWLTTPDWHRIHHSADQPETDSNFGSLVVGWDRLFGTFRNPTADGPDRIGLGAASDLRAGSWVAQLSSPFDSDRRWRGADGRLHISPPRG